MSLINRTTVDTQNTQDTTPILTRNDTHRINFGVLITHGAYRVYIKHVVLINHGVHGVRINHGVLKIFEEPGRQKKTQVRMHKTNEMDYPK